MVGSTHFGTSRAVFAWAAPFRRAMAGLKGVGLAGVLGLTGELLGVVVALFRAGLPLRRVPAVNALSRCL